MNPTLFCNALGWALFHSLWQFGLLWMVYFIATSSSKFSAAGKHALALAVNLTGFVWFLVTLISACSAAEPVTAGFFETGVLPAGSVRYIQELADKYLIYITYAYLLVTGWQFIKFIYVFYQSNLLYATGVSKVPVALRHYVRKMSMQLHITRRVQVFISEYVDTPMVIGFLKPTILMPVACVNQLSLFQLESILLHELVHIRRNDYLINIYVAASEILFFFNPFARLLLQAVKSEREHSCDDWVMQYDYNPHQYASALLLLEKSRTGYVKTGLAATGISRRILLNRVQRILNVPVTRKNRIKPLTALFAAAGLVFFCACLPPRVMPSKGGLQQEFYRLAKRLSFRKKVTAEQYTMFTAFQPAVVPVNRPEAHQNTRAPLSSLAAVAAPEQEDINDNIIPVASVSDELSDLSPIQVQALNIEPRNFSLPEPTQPEAPATITITDYPYVPASSFYFSADTAKPRVKPESYHDRSARESLMKTKKALSEIDWNAIQKNLPKKVNIEQLRRQLESSIDQLNWLAINQEIRDSINVQTKVEYQQALSEELKEMDKWKAQQTQYQKIQIQLKEQQEKYKADAQVRELDLQKQAAKGKVIVIL